MNLLARDMYMFTLSNLPPTTGCGLPFSFDLICVNGYVSRSAHMLIHTRTQHIDTHTHTRTNTSTHYCNRLAAPRLAGNHTQRTHTCIHVCVNQVVAIKLSDLISSPSIICSTRSRFLTLNFFNKTMDKQPASGEFEHHNSDHRPH